MSFARDHGGHRVAVAHRLAQRDDVGDHAVHVEPPQVRAGPAEPRLDLVGHEQPAGRAPAPYGVLQVVARRREDAVAGEPRVHEQCGRRDAALGERGDALRPRVPRSARPTRFLAAMRTAVAVRRAGRWPRSSGPSPRTHSSGERSAITVVTPWYANSVTSPPLPPVTVVASRHARSFASLPEFTSITVSRPSGMVAINRSASSSAAPVR